MSRLRSTPPGTPFSLSPRNRVALPRLRRQYVRSAADSKARTPEHRQPQSVNRPGENCPGLTAVNRRRVRYAVPGESGLIHPNQNGVQGGCLSVDGDNRGSAALPDQRRSPKQLQVRYTEHGKPYGFSGRGQSRLTARKAEGPRGYRMLEEAKARGNARDRGSTVAPRRKAADFQRVLSGSPLQRN
jgi:hypothetical protein